MKKITSLTLMALTLCLQHESHAMYSGLRNYATQFGNRIGQQCTRLYNQGAQRFAPTYQRLTTGARQQLSNFRPQASQWYSAARNWRQNLNLPTARATALGLGAGLTTAAYVQHPYFLGAVKAEEENNPAYERAKLDLFQLNNAISNINQRNLYNLPMFIDNAYKFAMEFIKNHLDTADLTIQDKFRNLVLTMENKISEFSDINDNRSAAEKIKFLETLPPRDLREMLVENKIAIGILQRNFFENIPWGITQSQKRKIILTDKSKEFLNRIKNSNTLKIAFTEVMNDLKSDIINNIINQEITDKERRLDEQAIKIIDEILTNISR